jgi:hypothetical protein
MSLDQEPPFSVIVLTSASPPRRPSAEAERSLSSSATKTLAAGAWLETALGLSMVLASAKAI